MGKEQALRWFRESDGPHAGSKSNGVKVDVKETYLVLVWKKKDLSGNDQV